MKNEKKGLTLMCIFLFCPPFIVVSDSSSGSDSDSSSSSGGSASSVSPSHADRSSLAAL
jgi:hypothetical protein